MIAANNGKRKEAGPSARPFAFLAAVADKARKIPRIDANLAPISPISEANVI